jgi:hypothetical protein
MVIPLDRKNDQQALREALEEDCLALLKNDPDDRVRYEALLAVGNFERPLRSEDPISDRLVALFVESYRHDPSPRIRAEVVKTFRLIPNTSADIRGVLRDALVDPHESIRHEGQAAVRSQALGGPKLPFDEARRTIDAALQSRDAVVRVGAVQALNLFETAAAGYVSTLGRLSTMDPDPQVRASARLAIEAIERASQAKK